MADVTERTLALLSALQTGRPFSGEELTRRLGVSARTLRRDVDRLRGYGYPVETRPGPGGHYRLAAGRTMPPLVLDDDEAVATLLALASLAATGAPGEGADPSGASGPSGPPPGKASTTPRRAPTASWTSTCPTGCALAWPPSAPAWRRARSTLRA